MNETTLEGRVRPAFKVMIVKPLGEPEVLKSGLYIREAEELIDVIHAERPGLEVYIELEGWT